MNHSYYKKIKDELLKTNKLIKKNGFLFFNEDYVFDSLSAAAVALARSAQGPQEWKFNSGITVGDSINK